MSLLGLRRNPKIRNEELEGTTGEDAALQEENEVYWNDGDEYGIASLDNAVWFHRQPNINEWHLSDMHALVNHGGRSHVRLTIRDRAGRVVASVGQELLVKVLPD